MGIVAIGTLDVALHAGGRLDGVVQALVEAWIMSTGLVEFGANVEAGHTSVVATQTVVFLVLIDE